MTKVEKLKVILNSIHNSENKYMYDDFDIPEEEFNILIEFLSTNGYILSDKIFIKRDDNSICLVNLEEAKITEHGLQFIGKSK